MCNFHVGQKVVCIANTKTKINDMGLPGFVKGQVLTVSDVFFHDCFGILPEDQAFLKFHETGPFHSGHHSGFRPVVTRKSDISIFTDMLTDTKIGEPA